jgi:hypothetical protein
MVGEKDTLARKNPIVKAMKSRYVHKAHKYGIRLPKIFIFFYVVSEGIL